MRKWLLLLCLIGAPLGAQVRIEGPMCKVGDSTAVRVKGPLCPKPDTMTTVSQAPPVATASSSAMKPAARSRQQVQSQGRVVPDTAVRIAKGNPGLPGLPGTDCMGLPPTDPPRTCIGRDGKDGVNGKDGRDGQPVFVGQGFHIPKKVWIPATIAAIAGGVYLASQPRVSIKVYQGVEVGTGRP